jgi:hypothetical protein
MPLGWFWHPKGWMVWQVLAGDAQASTRITVKKRSRVRKSLTKPVEKTGHWGLGTVTTHVHDRE